MSVLGIIASRFTGGLAGTAGRIMAEEEIHLDDNGEVKGSDVAGTFKGGTELARKLAGSKQVGDCAVRQLMRFSLGRKETAADQCSLNLSLDRYLAAKGSLYGALEGMVESDSFVKRRRP